MLFVKLYIYLKYKKKEKLLKCNNIIIYKTLCYLVSLLVGLNFYKFLKKLHFYL